MAQIRSIDDQPNGPINADEGGESERRAIAAEKFGAEDQRQCSESDVGEDGEEAAHSARLKGVS